MTALATVAYRTGLTWLVAITPINGAMVLPMACVGLLVATRVFVGRRSR